MKNFDTENSVNPFLVEGAYLYLKDDVFYVIDMDKEHIYIKNESSDSLRITDKDWNPIKTDKHWLEKLNLSLDETIKNPKTNAEWIIKYTGKYYYLTIQNEYSYGDNPVIPLHYVHVLQEWYFRLTNIILK